MPLDTFAASLKIFLLTCVLTANSKESIATYEARINVDTLI